VAVGASAGMGVVDGFCCRGDVLSVDGDAGVAVEAGVHVGWSEFRQLMPLLTGRDVSLIGRGGCVAACVEKRHLIYRPSKSVHQCDLCM